MSTALGSNADATEIVANLRNAGAGGGGTVASGAVPRSFLPVHSGISLVFVSFRFVNLYLIHSDSGGGGTVTKPVETSVGTYGTVPDAPPSATMQSSNAPVPLAQPVSWLIIDVVDRLVGFVEIQKTNSTQYTYRFNVHTVARSTTSLRTSNSTFK